jgi:2-polyprenyl-3-methyl-5-hydroxy-6-metoxy-1,4-benzoquinol methylase
MLLAQKLPFLERMVRHRLSGRRAACPYCGGTQALRRIARKKIVLDVYACDECLLWFRWPMETQEEFHRFYQGEYQEGAITALPAPGALQAMLANGFRGTSLDIAGKIALLRALKPSGRVLEYGCSWGYGIHQLRESGYEVAGYEIASPRAQFGRTNLGVEILEDTATLERFCAGRFDVIFSNHVVEHIPALQEAFVLFSRLLRPGGLAFIVLPNFTGAEARNGRFLNWIGEAHPVAPTHGFFERNLPSHGFGRVRCFSGPFTEQMALMVAQGRFEEFSSDGDELLALAWKE